MDQTNQTLIDRDRDADPDAQLRNLIEVATLHQESIAREDAADIARYTAKVAQERAEHEQWQRGVEARMNASHAKHVQDVLDGGGAIKFALDKIAGSYVAEMAEERIAALEARIAILEAANDKR